MSSGESNIGEYHGVGSILPRFKYQEEVRTIPDKTNKY